MQGYYVYAKIGKKGILQETIFLFHFISFLDITVEYADAILQLWNWLAFQKTFGIEYLWDFKEFVGKFALYYNSN